MEIIQNDIEVTHKSVKPGEVFKSPITNHFYIKTDYRYGDVDWSTNLETGVLSCFKDNDIVTPITAKVVIE